MADPDEIQVRKVKMLNDRAEEEAINQGLKDDDLVILKTTYGSLPTYRVQKIEGSPIKYLQKELIKSD